MEPLVMTIESTPDIVQVDGTLCRVWIGRTAEGEQCTVLVHRVVANRTSTINARLEKLLKEQGPPADLVDVLRRTAL